jgi:uncharacterized protein YyaL (SSP411 family)
MQLIDKQVFIEKTKPTLVWLKASFEACEAKGSAAYFSRLRHPLTGWAAPYPETTGYLIETMLDYHNILQEDWLFDYAKNGADWICTLQKENGALPGGLGENGKESVFNTGMMLFGLIAMYENTKNEKYLATAQKAVNWLLEIVEKDGSWKQGAYYMGFTPSYYTRVVWAVLKLNSILQNADIQSSMQSIINYYKAKKQTNGAIKDWAFKPNEKAFTHTIAYTMRGFLESAILLNDDEALIIAENMAKMLFLDFEKRGKLAGAYDENWSGDCRFICLTGNAQLSINAMRLFQIADNHIYKDFSIQLYNTISDAPCKIPIKGYYGGIAGSSPYWGKYQPMQMINWAAKFWLDAVLLAHQRD